MTDTFRKVQKILKHQQKYDIDLIKDQASDLLHILESCGATYTIDPPCMEMAEKRLEEAVMWAVKAIT